MESFEVHILGCGSALPTRHHVPSAQVIRIRGKLFMIDCGEGTQLQFRLSRLNFNKIQDIFISHLHGDHCFGLIGLISSMGMLGRIAPLTIHANEDLEKVLKPQIDYFCENLQYKIIFNAYNPLSSECIYSDRSVEVYTLPLIHRVPTAGFLFKEVKRKNHINKDMAQVYDIPLSKYPKIKNGEDFVTSDGNVIPNEKLIIPADEPRSYAYCSDTAYNDKLVPLLQNVNLLYHEATYCEAEEARAEKTQHSTAAQAAIIAKKVHAKKLVIGHFSARYVNDKVLLNESAGIFPDVELANEGKVFEVI